MIPPKWAQWVLWPDAKYRVYQHLMGFLACRLTGIHNINNEGSILQALCEVIVEFPTQRVSNEERMLWSHHGANWDMQNGGYWSVHTCSTLCELFLVIVYVLVDSIDSFTDILQGCFTAVVAILCLSQYVPKDILFLEEKLLNTC